MSVLPSVLVDEWGVAIEVWSFWILERLYLDMGEQEDVDVFVQ